ncbi:MAG: hypothetical protein ACKN9V_06365 [Pseudomonadota bacterium]
MKAYTSALHIFKKEMREGRKGKCFREVKNEKYVAESFSALKKKTVSGL